MEHQTEANIIDNQMLYQMVNTRSKQPLCRAAFYKNIAKMIENNHLIRVGRGRYQFSDRWSFNYVLESDLANQVLMTLESFFEDRIPFVVYESTLLNRFLNHLIAHPTVIVETTKSYIDDLFWKLKTYGFNDVMVNPSDDDRYRYEPRIIIKTMISKAPIDTKKHALTAEKLIVDIVCDKVLKQFYECAEIPSMLETMFAQHSIRIDTVRTYAKRRHAYEALLQCLPNGDKCRFDD